METKQRGRPKMCRGTKQRKQDFNSKLKAYSPTALDNVIKIAETSFSAETKLIETLTDNENDDSEPWEEPWGEDIYRP